MTTVAPKVFNYDFKITNYLLNMTVEIMGLLRDVEALPSNLPKLYLRKDNQVRTISSTTQIEGNSLSRLEVMDILDGKVITGDELEIREVKNAISLYASIGDLDPQSKTDFLLAHKILMNDLIDNSGKLRTVNVGIRSKNGAIIYKAPKFEVVEDHIDSLFSFLKADRELNIIIKSSLIHYLIESIHPFEDGNGRMGRFWQSLILSKRYDFFKYIPIEEYIRDRQEKYYQSLKRSQSLNDPVYFVEFMVKVILDAVNDYRGISFESPRKSSFERRMLKAQKVLGESSFSRKNYISAIGDISKQQATLDLKKGVSEGGLRSQGSGNQTRYAFLGLKIKNVARDKD